MTALAAELEVCRRFAPERVSGRVAAVRGMTLLVDDLLLPVGASVEVESSLGEPVPAEVVGFSREQAILMPLTPSQGVRPGAMAHSVTNEQLAPVGIELLGRVVNGMGRPIDQMGMVTPGGRGALAPTPLGPMERARVTEPIRTGVRAIDLMTPMGRGQRMGIFAGPGVGKSTLLGQIARGTSAQVCVIALIGERGREVRDFIEESLGEEGLRRSVVVAATGDESPLMRIRAARYACAAAEHFRDQGLDVLLMMDSVTRFAHAQRQVGLSVGEPPATRGYTPSVFAELALLLERAGPIEREGVSGSVTGLYTILVEGDDMTEPVADAARGILDGHLVLKRDLAQEGHFPAIDVLDSVSRVVNAVADEGHLAARQQIVTLLAAYERVKELVQIGAYARGSDAEADIAIELRDAINAILRQGVGEPGEFGRDLQNLTRVALQGAEELQSRRAATGAQQGGEMR
ncbi:MAG: FliI/YscN family ATPase [Planctomycetota bacterium]